MPEWRDADEVQLLEQAVGGDAEAFGQLYDHYAPVIFRYLFYHLDDRLDAEDLTGEVFLRTWQSLPRYHHRGAPFVAFLFRVTRNALIDFYRRNSRKGPNLPLDENDVQDSNPNPAEAALVRLERKEVRQMMTHLREDYQTVLELRFWGDLSPGEAARVMGRSPGAIRVLQHRALAALRKLIPDSVGSKDVQEIRE